MKRAGGPDEQASHEKRVRFAETNDVANANPNEADNEPQPELVRRRGRRGQLDDGLDILGRLIEEDPSTSDSAAINDPDKKHTLDSDEEDEVRAPTKLDVHRVVGQEKATIEYDGKIKIMPFNMNEEMEEGSYDEEGNYVFNKEKEEIHDQWLDNVDWDAVKHKAGDQWHKMEDEPMADESGEKSNAEGILACQKVIKFLTSDTLTANDVLKTLNSKKNLSAAEERKQRWAAKKKGVEYKNDHSEAANELTGAIDDLITLGHMDAYSMNKEKIFALMEDFEVAKELQERQERMKRVSDIPPPDAIEDEEAEIQRELQERAERMKRLEAERTQPSADAVDMFGE